MRLLLSFFFVLSYFVSNAQEKNSLLWEISGNGLKQSSYLYGTMHVSKKIAFRLDDVFYEALNNSEVIALESDPNTWLDNEDSMGFTFGESFMTKGFYTNTFKIENPKKEELSAYLGLEDQMINSILYRSDESSQNFEEDTYLDMFIYQAGKKFGKSVIALEDTEESTALVGRASFNSLKEKPAEWLQKKMQQQEPLQLLQDAYRERNINLLDSIDKGMYTPYYLQNMLYTRNNNMAIKLDSTIKRSKVFAGIGAAHLPGERGVIALLRKKGYTVKALTSKTTEKGTTLKEVFEEKIKENKYSYQTVDDSLFSISLPNKLYPIAEFSNTFYISPDLANGSFFTVNRIPTYSFLKKDAVYTIEDIDKLLFENIPGKIVAKNKIVRNGFEGIDVKNLLKNGEHQRYQIFVTPLEIIIFKMGGHGTFVTQYSDTIFNSIRFKEMNNTLKMVHSIYDDFEVEMPSNYAFTNTSRSGNRFIQGVDSKNNTYRFLKKATLHDFNYIEEDTFELKQIQHRFYQDLELKGVYKEFNHNSLKSSAVTDSLSGKKLHLMTKIKGEDYYLLGISTTDTEEAKAYFNSFTLKAPKYHETYSMVKDTALFFTTIAPVKPPKFVVNSNGYTKKDIKPYDAYSKRTVYQNKNNEAITVQLNKSHDFLMFTSIDSVWSLRKKLYSYKRFNITHEKISQNPKGYSELQLTLTDTASTRGILIKNILKGGALYELQAVIDTVSKPSKFVQEFFDNFQPLDTIISKDILADKTNQFFKALRSNDSIILNGYQFIQFEKKHIDSLKNIITEFDFKESQKNIQSYLIERLAAIDDSDAIDFYNDFYQKSYNNSSSQTKVLQAIAKKSTSESAKQLLNLMSVDLPLASSSYEIFQIFKPYMDSLPLAKKLYPEILDYSAIEEYKSSIFSLLAKLKAEGLVKPSSYKKYRKQMLNDAKIQLKRALGKSKNKNTSQHYDNFYLGKQNSVLEDYVQLLQPFAKEKEVQLFFEKLNLLEDPDIQTTKAALLASTPNAIKTEELNKLAAAINSRNLLFLKLKEAGKLSLFPKTYKTQKQLAESQLFERKNTLEEKDSIVFISQKEIIYRNKKYIGYVFKHRDGEDYDKNFKMYLSVYEDTDTLKGKPFYNNSGYRIEDTDTDEEMAALVIEEFLLRERPRAEAYRPDQGNNFGYYDY
ncbi:TraB/GumN family protein [Cellulophaga sp. Z1A5H]|uniref:TraB/GumN family protein n=1 Tax=Cellulophaga sp. Z1A5H TaxID=2687291 RepID=UPI0013FE026F|nr:TraB/GumN family protein [Cellulophaga sp. Z1A5H]